jgi:hypothetical protein
MRRAAAWDGAVPLFLSARHGHPPTTDELSELVRYIEEHRSDRRGEPFDIVVGGATHPGTATDVIRPLIEAGATWWDERLPQDEPGFDQLGPVLRRVEQGPPRL